MPAMREIEWEACLLEPVHDEALEDRFRRETGRPADSVPYFTGSDRCAEVLISLSGQLAKHVHLDPELADFVGMVVSQDNSCRFCFGATRAFLRILGMSERRIEQLEHDLPHAELSRKERVALDFARKLSRSNPLATGRDLRALEEAGFSRIEAVELAANASLHLFFNRVATLAALPPRRLEELPDKWYMRLLRPLVKYRLRDVRKSVKPVQLAPGEAQGPFEGLVLALEGLPLAGEFRRLIDCCLDPKALTPRAVALVFAVVGRALGQPGFEAESVAMVERLGFPAPELEPALAHLASPAFDDLERTIVPFARETVWYRPAQLQRRGREVFEELSREQFLEFLATASLANSVGRLWVVCDEPA